MSDTKQQAFYLFLFDEINPEKGLIRVKAKKVFGEKLNKKMAIIKHKPDRSFPEFQVIHIETGLLVGKSFNREGAIYDARQKLSCYTKEELNANAEKIRNSNDHKAWLACVKQIQNADRCQRNVNKL